jgi:hypothetical protein
MSTMFSENQHECFSHSGFPAATTLDICPPTTNVCFTIMLNELEISKKFLTLLFLGMLSTYFHLQQGKTQL